MSLLAPLKRKAACGNGLTSGTFCRGRRVERLTPSSPCGLPFPAGEPAMPVEERDGSDGARAVRGLGVTTAARRRERRPGRAAGGGPRLWHLLAGRIAAADRRPAT